MRGIPDILRHFFSAMLKSSSPGEDKMNTLFYWFLILSAVIMTIVIVSVLIGAIKYRHAKTKGEPRQVTGNTWLEITWTAIPLLILILFFYFTVKDMKDISAPMDTSRNPDYVITGHQWWWEMQYPDLNITTANELHVPSGKKLLAKIGSADVIHDWWVPALGPKIDAIPGRSNFLWIDVSAPGEYTGSCSEYCGTQHAGMRILVIADSDEAFREWVKSQQNIPVMPSDSLGLSGYKLFHDKTCAGCHSVAGTDARSRIGPDLTHVSTRKTLGSGVIVNTPENLYKWIENPQKIKIGINMPDFHLSKNEITALVKYLEGLK